jgi:hypothetical protein
MKQECRGKEQAEAHFTTPRFVGRPHHRAGEDVSGALFAPLVCPSYLITLSLAFIIDHWAVTVRVPRFKRGLRLCDSALRVPPSLFAPLVQAAGLRRSLAIEKRKSS